MHTYRFLAALLLAFSLTLLSSAVVQGQEQTIVGGATSVTFNPTFLSLGLNVTPIGSATLDGATATFPITGGTLNTNTSLALIEHDGSGLTLDDGTSFLDLENFLINTGTPGITGDATLDGGFVGNVPLFELGAGLEVLLTAAAADVLDATFLGDTNALVGGEEIGNAVTSPVVPEPSTLLLTSMAAMSLCMRTRGIHY